jgi:hypothetical protein
MRTPYGLSVDRHALRSCFSESLPPSAKSLASILAVRSNRFKVGKRQRPFAATTVAAHSIPKMARHTATS